MKNVVIVGYARSPFHFAHKGSLVKVRPDDLAAQVVRGLLDKVQIDPKDIEDFLVGCAFPEGEQGFNVARLIGFLADLPLSVAGATINRFCGSSMQAIHTAAGAIAMGAGNAFLCGGIESMSRIPMGGFNPMPNPTLMKKMPQAYMAMGETAENVARQYQITRDAQQKLAIASQHKAAAAQKDGKFKDEIIPITTRDGTMVNEDGCIRPDTTMEGLSGLKPAFQTDGTVTAGTSSPLTDGASAVLVTSEEYAKAHGLPILAKIKSFAVGGCAPEIMGIGPVVATRKALERAGLKIEDIGLFEVNEAFASQALACAQELGIDQNKMNIDGGAIALGHPLGATGARITGKIASLMQREGKEFGLSTQCIGGGQGITTILQAA